MLFTQIPPYLTAFALLWSSANAVVPIASCAADNCARLVTGTSAAVKPALTIRSTDCLSFFRTTTVYRPTAIVLTTTSTYGATSTTTTTVAAPAANKKRHVKRGELEERQADLLSTSFTTTTSLVTPSSLPTYAVASCGSPERYSSACSCFANILRAATDVTAATITTTSTITTDAGTSTSTATVTTTPAAAAATCPQPIQQGDGNLYRCASGCLCSPQLASDPVVPGAAGICVSGFYNSPPSCSSNADCPTGTYCIGTNRNAQAGPIYYGCAVVCQN